MIGRNRRNVGPLQQPEVRRANVEALCAALHACFAIDAYWRRVNGARKRRAFAPSLGSRLHRRLQRLVSPQRQLGLLAGGRGVDVHLGLNSVIGLLLLR